MTSKVVQMGFPGSSNGKEFACNTRDLDSIPGSGRSPGEGHGNPLLYSCLENPMDRRAWRATVQAVAELDMTKWLSHNMTSIDVKENAYIYRERGVILKSTTISSQNFSQTKRQLAKRHQ